MLTQKASRAVAARIYPQPRAHLSPRSKPFVCTDPPTLSYKS
jgi:hypothetical protein